MNEEHPVEIISKDLKVNGKVAWLLKQDGKYMVLHACTGGFCTSESDEKGNIFPKMDLKYCAGCHDNFYNTLKNSIGGKCWMLSTAKMIMRKEVSIDQTPPWTQDARLFPSCYHKPRFVYVKPEQTC